MVIQFSAILEPDNFGPWFSRGHANEHNFVAQDILIVEMRGLCDSRSLTKKKDKRCRYFGQHDHFLEASHSHKQKTESMIGKWAISRSSAINLIVITENWDVKRHHYLQKISCLYA